MTPGNLEADFERWRHARDLDALAAVFDAVAPELLRVAHHLCRDEAAAEDLVQTTFLEVLRHPARFRAGNRLVPWLVGVLTRHAGKLHRANRRAIDPDRAARSSPLPPDDVVAGKELGAVVHGALLTLAEPYGSVVRAHLVDGARAVDLAAQRACEPGTIRMQLSRGLAMLRRALPVGFAVPLTIGRAEALARTRDAVLTHAASLPLATAPLALIGVAMSQKILAGAGVAALAALAAFAWITFQIEPIEPPPGTSAPNAVLVAARADASTGGEVGASSVIERPGDGDAAARSDRAAATVAPPPGQWLIGTVESPRRTGEPRVVVEVSLWGQNKSCRGEAMDDGSFTIDLAPLFTEPSPLVINQRIVIPTFWQAPSGLQSLYVVARHDVCMPRTATPTIDLGDGSDLRTRRREVRQDFRLVAASVLTGQLDARDVERGSVALFVRSALARPVAEPTAVVENVDAEGRFELRSEAEGAVELWAFHPDALPRAVRAVATLGQRQDVGTIRLGGRGVEVTGDVQLPHGLAKHASVVLTRRLPKVEPQTSTTFHGLARVDGKLLATMHTAEIRNRGTFRFASVEPGEWRLHLQSAGGVPLCPRDPGLAITAPAAGLSIGAELRLCQLEVHDDAGPVAGASVTVTCGAESVALTTDAEGSAKWLGGAFDYALEITAPSHHRQELTVAAHEAPTLHRRVFVQRAATASLELTIDDAMPAVETKVRVTLRDLATSPVRFEGHATIDRGALRLDGLPSGRFVVRLHPATSGVTPNPVAGLPTATVELDLVLHAGQTTKATVRRPAVGRLCLDARFEAPTDARLGKVEVRDAAGRLVPTTSVIERPDGWLEGTGLFDGRGLTTIRPDLPVGHYSIVCTHQKLGTRRFDITITSGATTTQHIER